MSNNPPDVVLELTAEQARFLLENCESNMVFALSALQTVSSASAAEKIVRLNEQFKEIRNMLSAQGVKSDT